MITKEKTIAEFKKEGIGISSGLCARLETTKKFFRAFAKAINKPFDGSDEIPLGSWADGVDRTDIKRLQRDYGFESIMSASFELEGIRKAFHGSIAQGLPIRKASRMKRVLKDLRKLIGCETILAKNSSKSVITYRLLNAGVIDKHYDRDSIATNYEFYDKALSDAIKALSHQIEIMRKLVIRDAREQSIVKQGDAA